MKETHLRVFSCGDPPAPIALWLLLAIMTIKFAEQIFLRSNRITRVSSWSEEFALALGAGGHRRDLALMPQDHKVAFSHGAERRFNSGYWFRNPGRRGRFCPEK